MTPYINWNWLWGMSFNMMTIGIVATVASTKLYLLVGTCLSCKELMFLYFIITDVLVNISLWSFDPIWICFMTHLAIAHKVIALAEARVITENKGTFCCFKMVNHTLLQVHVTLTTWSTKSVLINTLGIMEVWIQEVERQSKKYWEKHEYLRACKRTCLQQHSCCYFWEPVSLL